MSSCQQQRSAAFLNYVLTLVRFFRLFAQKSAKQHGRGTEMLTISSYVNKHMVRGHFES